MTLRYYRECSDWHLGAGHCPLGHDVEQHEKEFIFRV
jgi:hypothetical protein